MRLFASAMVLAALLLGCQQKSEQQAAQTGTPSATPPQGQAQAPATPKETKPRPPMRQSDARVWVESVSAAKGSKGAFKIQYYGVEEAKAIVVPLAFPKGLKVDSISFVGSMLSYLANRPVRIENDQNFLLMTAIPMTEPNIPAKEGVLATVHFTLGSDAVSGKIDETFVPPGNYLTYVDTATTLVEPVFEAGQLTVK